MAWRSSRQPATDPSLQGAARCLGEADRLPGQVEAFCHGPCAVSGPLKLIVRRAQQRSNECRQPADHLGMPRDQGGARTPSRLLGSRLQAPSCWTRQTYRRRSSIGKATTRLWGAAILPSQANACVAKAHALRRCLGGVIYAMMQKSRRADRLATGGPRRISPITQAFVQRHRAAGAGEPRAPPPCDMMRPYWRADRICFASTARCE
jgi:hypothetical protein